MHAVDGRKTLHLDDYIAALARFESEGFARIWATQMPNDPDTLTVLAVAGREVPRIEFATGVLPIQPQHPMNLAQRALTVNAITGGRLTLGIGLTHQVVTEGMWGIPYDRPLRRMGEYLDGLLPLLCPHPGRRIGRCGRRRIRRHRLRPGRAGPGPDPGAAARTRRAVTGRR